MAWAATVMEKSRQRRWHQCDSPRAIDWIWGGLYENRAELSGYGPNAKADGSL